MRIEGPARQTGSVRRKGASQGSAPSFEAGSSVSQARAEAAGPVAASTGIDAILALQGVDDPLQSRRKAVRRGRSLLDALEALRADLLAGAVGEGRLHRILALVGQAKTQTEPELDALIADIELRARVELAKLGVFAPA